MASTSKNGSSLTRRRDKERDEAWKAAPSRGNRPTITRTERTRPPGGSANPWRTPPAWANTRPGAK